MGVVTIDLAELQDSAQKAFPADKLIPARDPAWRSITEMGWLMIELPEALGGLGLGRDASCTLHFEMGRVLSSAPLIPALLALQAISASESLANRSDWIERICGGEYVPFHLLPASVTARTGGLLEGCISGVFEADKASHVLVTLAESLILIPLDAQGVTVVEHTVWDKSRRLCDVELSGYALDPALVVAEGDTAGALQDLIARNAQLALAADALGGATAVLAMTVDYLKMRKQFDRPLAMFQAIKHRCADLRIQIGAAEALLWSRINDPDASLVDCGAAKALATDVYRIVVEEAIQLHGGIGLTAEHQCHRFLKRAMLNLQLAGDGDHWREATGRAALAALV